ncbi:MAG TPA: diacylglycerol kinase family protein [Terriglobales bacterium]|nr:diacylglycerol kinase family protein [Terriglobales bacterium]
MTVLAILGPRSRPQDLALFQARLPHLTVLHTPDTPTVRDNLVHASLAIIFGGDGTLNRHLGALVESNVPVLLVPSGSGNDFAQTNGIRNVQDALAAFHLFQSGQPLITYCDLGLLVTSEGHRRYFSCCANVGLDADATRRANSLPNWIKARSGYLLGGLAAIACYQPSRLTVNIDDNHAISENGWFVAVSNTPIYGGGLLIAPAASITDGRLNVTYLRATSRLNLIRHYPRILNGTHIHLPIIAACTAQNIVINTASLQPVYADGEPMGTTPCTISVAPRLIRVLRPK